MKKMNIPLVGTLMVLSLVVCPILYFHMGPALNESQLEVFKLIGIIAGCSALFCFIVGELSGNNSQVDKVWSILPFVYCWIIAIKGGMHPRLVVMAVLATLWGLRLSFNFARKGAYRLKFWEGEEDYRWKMLNAGQKLEDLPAPYNKGFNTIGLWNVSRHPNYLAEQSIWVSLYIFSIGAGIGIINWSMIGALLLIVLFIASTSLAEEISSSKYPEYPDYCKKVNKYFPGKKFR